jgi:hypothetical protein
VACPTISQVGSDDDGYAVRLKLHYFWEYCDHPEHGLVDDSPLYIFDGKGHTRAGLSCHASVQFDVIVSAATSWSVCNLWVVGMHVPAGTFGDRSGSKHLLKVRGVCPPGHQWK